MPGEGTKFKPGNPGKPKGAKSEKTKQWEALAEALTGYHADRYNQVLEELMTSAKPLERIRGCELYLQSLEYFKPKQARVTHAGDANEPVQIVIPGNL